jgi:hypothetical protein
MRRTNRSSPNRRLLGIALVTGTLVTAGALGVQVAGAGENGAGRAGGQRSAAEFCRQLSGEEAARCAEFASRFPMGRGQGQGGPGQGQGGPGQGQGGPGQGQGGPGQGQGGPGQGQGGPGQGQGGPGQGGPGQGQDGAAPPDAEADLAAKEQTLKDACRAFARADFAVNGGADREAADDGNPLGELETDFLNSCIAVAKGAAAAGGVDINNPEGGAQTPGR